MAGWSKSKGSKLYPGFKVGHLTLRGRVRSGKNTPVYRKKSWRCECECGKLLTVPEYYLTRENPKTHCGCKTATFKSMHNSEYRIWCMMKQRCYFPHHIAYKNYGGRGIKMCDRWLHGDPVTGKDGFECFFEDVGPRPKPHHKWSIDRINPDGNYELYGPDGKLQVRWATAKEQAQTTRRAIAKKQQQQQAAE